MKYNSAVCYLNYFIKESFQRDLNKRESGKLSYFDNYYKEGALPTKSPFSEFLDGYKFKKLVYTQHILCHMKSKITVIYFLSNLKLIGLEF